MKKKSLYIGLSAVAALCLGSCSNEEIMLDGEGYLAVRTAFDTAVKAESRALSDDETAHLNETLQLWVYQHTGDEATSGVIHRYTGMDNVPTSLALKSGNYSVEAWAGDSVSASWDKRWFHGVSDLVASEFFYKKYLKIA